MGVVFKNVTHSTIVNLFSPLKKGPDRFPKQVVWMSFLDLFKVMFYFLP